MTAFECFYDKQMLCYLLMLNMLTHISLFEFRYLITQTRPILNERKITAVSITIVTETAPYVTRGDTCSALVGDNTDIALKPAVEVDDNSVTAMLEADVTIEEKMNEMQKFVTEQT